MATKGPDPGRSLLDLFPEVAQMWHATRNEGVLPSMVGPGSHRKVWWTCDQDHEWVATIYSRVAGNGCPYCSNQKVLPGYNDLATTNPELAAEAYYWDPTTLTAISGQKREWRCTNDHVWSDSIAHRSYGRGCPICSNKKVLAGYNDLATLRPEVATEWHFERNAPLQPTEVSAQSHKSVWWLCSQGHEWKSTITNRSNLLIKAGCPYCSNQKVLPGYNDLATTNPELAAEAHGWDPSTITGGANQKRTWMCSEGHEWKALVSARSRGNGCPVCSTSGFNPSLDGWLYFLVHPEWRMHQIGISNQPDNRLADHRRLGWEVIEVRGPMSGDLTQKLELEAIRALKRRGAVFGARGSKHKFDGHTEAWTIDSLAVDSLGVILDWIYEDD